MIERIFTRAPGDGSTHEHQSVRVVTGAGVEGDRYFDRHEEPGQNVTLVEAEEIERFISAHGRPHDLSITGRNLVTRAVRLNDLVGREFRVGAVLLRGVELCEPCLGLGEALAAGNLTPATVVKAFVHRAGLRADVLSTGSIAVGDVVTGERRAPEGHTMTALRRMAAEEFEAWLSRAIPTYAAEKVASGHWSAEGSEELSRKEHGELLPQGLASEGNHFFTVLDQGANPVGTLWFAVKTKFGLPIAYVFNVEVEPEHRRKGHARRAFEALEGEVAALGLHGVALHVFGHNTAARGLYAGLGYEPTNINLFKRVHTGV